MAKETKKQKAEETEKQHAEPPVSEWIVAAIGLLLVAGAIGFMVYKAISDKETPPTLSVSVESIAPINKGYLVKFRVKNTGDLTAASLTIEGELKNGAESVETSTAMLTYAPSHSEREGGLYFSKNPNEYQLEINPKGYEKP
jgi:uncharacterized protein (TIGR02588 family)